MSAVLMKPINVLRLQESLRTSQDTSRLLRICERAEEVISSAFTLSPERWWLFHRTEVYFYLDEKPIRSKRQSFKKIREEASAVAGVPNRFLSETAEDLLRLVSALQKHRERRPVATLKVSPLGDFANRVFISYCGEDALRKGLCAFFGLHLKPFTDRISYSLEGRQLVDPRNFYMKGLHTELDLGGSRYHSLGPIGLGAVAALKAQLDPSFLGTMRTESGFLTPGLERKNGWLRVSP